MRTRGSRSLAVTVPALLLGSWAVSCGSVADDRAAANISRIQAIGEKGGGTEEELEFLLDRLENGDAEERTSAAWAVGRAGSPEMVPPLIAAVREDRDRWVRINAITALGKLGGDGVREVLANQLASDDEDVLATTLKALAAERYSEAFGDVGRLLGSESASIRALAADTLGRMGDVEALSFLEGVTTDPDKDVRNFAAFAMGKLGDPRAVAHLTPMLADPEWEVRANAAQALGMIGDPSARPALEGMLEDSSDNVRFAAQAAIKKLG